MTPILCFVTPSGKSVCRLGTMHALTLDTLKFYVRKHELHWIEANKCAVPKYTLVAQSEEQRSSNSHVAGSSPAEGAN